MLSAICSRHDMEVWECHKSYEKFYAISLNNYPWAIEVEFDKCIQFLSNSPGNSQNSRQVLRLNKADLVEFFFFSRKMQEIHVDFLQ